MNTLYYGDNLPVLRRYIKDESVDLIYLDPPFNSKRDYNILFAEQGGTRSEAQLKAFKDTWFWDQEAALGYEEVVESGGRIAETMRGFRLLLGEGNMLAYLSMMAPRLVELRRVLKPTGSLYLHCDPTASHYLKLLLDAVFGLGGFRNEIIWCYRKWAVASSQFARNHDVILFYSKATDRSHFFAPQFAPVSVGTMKRWKGQKQRAYFEGGTRKATSEVEEKAQTPMADWWEISIINPNSKERLGYPTQKPEALLERIIRASSSEGDLVLDPFCGCGTAIAVAQRLGRRWIGIDITHLAISLIKYRLQNAFGDAAVYTVVGEPTTLSEAQALAEENRFQFQYWALGLVGARPVEEKKGADKGIDGRLYFHDEAVGGKTKQIIFSVKSGKTGVAHVRDLRGVIEREQAEIGVLITLEDSTQPMRAEAAGAGFYESAWGKHPRLQILTIADLLAGKRVDYPPPGQVNVTFKKAPRIRESGGEMLPLPLDSQDET